MQKIQNWINTSNITSLMKYIFTIGTGVNNSWAWKAIINTTRHDSFETNFTEIW
jgi:hypothetical protein